MAEATKVTSTTDGTPATEKFNVDAAVLLENQAQRLPITQAVPIYEQLLANFPTSARFWKQYVEAYMAVNNDDATKLIFHRCLLTCYHVPLWQCYIRFIRKVNERKGSEGCEEIRKAFDFMLSCVGGDDIGSGPLWMEYVSFLKALPALNRQEELQRNAAVRKVYQKAVVTPTNFVDQLWRDYGSFENSVARDLAKGILSDLQPKHRSARAIYRDRKKFVDDIDWNMLALPPTGSSKDDLQWVAWKKYLAFEKGNPERIEIVSANKRIVYTYEQCLTYLFRYPDIWYDYATWLAKAESVDASIKVFQRALKALPDSEVLKFAYAEMEESRGSIKSAKKIYETIVGDGVDASSLAHIQYIRFLRRTEGVEAARKYFMEARNSPSCTYHVYVAFAMMTFCLDKDPKLAHNVFENGLKTFREEPDYILKYVDFLYRLNDERNIRALFERTLSSLPAKDSVEVWKQFIQFEQAYGDLNSVLKVEQRMKEALSGSESKNDGSVSESSLQDVISRYSYMDLWPCSPKDLENLGRQERAAESMSKMVEKPHLPNGTSSAGKKSSANLMANSSPPAQKIRHPDTSRMVIYEPKQSNAGNSGTNITGLDEATKAAAPALAAFISNLPTVVEGPSPDVDYLLSVLLQSDIPVRRQSGKPANEAYGSSKFRPMATRLTRERPYGKRKERAKQEDDDDELPRVERTPLPRDAFMIRQTKKARKVTSQTGMVATHGSAVSGEITVRTW